MSMITDFFVADPEEVQRTSISDFPIGSVFPAKGIDSLILEKLAYLLMGIPFKPLFIHVKPDFSMLDISETGELDAVSTLAFLRQNYNEAEIEKMEWEWEEDLEDHFQAMDGMERSELIFTLPTIDRFHSDFVDRLASYAPEHLQKITPQWRTM